jgi:hypothetical protein
MMSTGTAVAKITADSPRKSELSKFSETKHREANSLR